MRHGDKKEDEQMRHWQDLQTLERFIGDGGGCQRDIVAEGELWREVALWNLMARKIYGNRNDYRDKSHSHVEMDTYNGETEKQ